MNELKVGDIYICKLTGKKAKINRLFRKGRGFSVVYVLGKRFDIDTFTGGHGLVISKTNFLKEFKLAKEQVK